MKRLLGPLGTLVPRRSLSSMVHKAPGMRKHSDRSLLPVLMASLLLTGIVLPAVALGQFGASTQTQGQLSALVGVAQTSKAYATSTVQVAASHGLDVTAAQVQIAQGDSLLATAQADAQAGSNISAGILAVQTAMRDFTYAATAASVALNNAHLTASVTYAAAAGAVAEVNASASAVASVTAQACAGASAGANSSSTLAQACTQVKADIASATVQLRQATSLLIQSNGTASASVDYSQVLSLVARARAEVNATQSGLTTIAASTYSQRGQAFVTSAVIPLSMEANATIKSEQAIFANFTQFQTSFNAYAQSQATASATIVSSASALATAIAQVNTGSVSTSISAAQYAATEVGLKMTALLGLVSSTLFPTIVADINTCNSAATSYGVVLSSAESQSAKYSLVQLSSFSTYVSLMSSDSTSAQSAGSAYASACATVVSDISTLFSIVGVQAIYNALVSLQISGSMSSASASLQQETTAMVTVQTDISSENSTIISSSSEVLLGANLVATAASI